MIKTLVSNENLNDKIIILKSDYKSLLLEENYIREKKMIDLILKKIHSDNIAAKKSICYQLCQMQILKILIL